jgi:hypothetical protein
LLWFSEKFFGAKIPKGHIYTFPKLLLKTFLWCFLSSLRPFLSCQFYVTDWWYVHSCRYINKEQIGKGNCGWKKVNCLIISPVRICLKVYGGIIVSNMTNLMFVHTINIALSFWKRNFDLFTECRKRGPSKSWN